MAFPYRRRRASLLRNVWVYRRLVLVALVLGLLLWFVWANNEPVVIAFPFGLGRVSSTTGVIILASAGVGSIASALVMTVVWAFRSRKGGRPELSGIDDLDEDDLPPPDYAARTGDGLSNRPGSGNSPPNGSG